MLSKNVSDQIIYLLLILMIGHFVTKDPGNPMIYYFCQILTLFQVYEVLTLYESECLILGFIFWNFFIFSLDLIFLLFFAFYGFFLLHSILFINFLAS